MIYLIIRKRLKARFALLLCERKVSDVPLAAVGVISIAGSASAQTSTCFDSTTTSAIPDTNNTIFVTDTAIERVDQDRVTAIFAVETVEETAGNALAANSEAINAVLTALLPAGVNENETSTAYFSIYPDYKYSEFGRQALAGYAVTNSTMAESSKLSNVYDWIDTSVNAGAARVDSISFTLSEESLSEIRIGLTEAAIDNARDKTEAIAQELNLQITGVKLASLFEFCSQPVLPLSASFPTDPAEY